MNSRLTPLLFVLLLFWAIFMLLAWVVGDVYLPNARPVLSSLVGKTAAEAGLWLTALLLFVLLLLTFRSLLNWLFWRQMEEKCPKAEG